MRPIVGHGPASGIPVHIQDRLDLPWQSNQFPVPFREAANLGVVWGELKEGFLGNLNPIGNRVVDSEVGGGKRSAR